MKVHVPPPPAPGGLPAAARRITRACRGYRARRRCPEFTLNEQAALQFLARALRRGAGDAETPAAGENWTLMPGWDLASVCADETGDAENLIYQATREAGVITCTASGADLELIIEVRPGGDWMYQWRVSFCPAARYAICSPGREEFRRLGRRPHQSQRLRHRDGHPPRGR